MQPAVIDPEDVDEAQTYGPFWADLLRFEVPAPIVSGLGSREMRVQTFAQAIGSLNLDFYPVMVTAFPTVGGTRLDARSCCRGSG